MPNDTPISRFWLQPSLWADKVLESLSLEEKIAQLLHVASWSDRGPEHEAEILHQIEHYGIGGLCFFQGTAAAQHRLTRQYQSASRVPLMISIDGEWGLAMRLRDTLAYPYATMLGHVADLDLLYQMGADMALQCKAIGVHVNHAPVVDINTEALNPVIGFRSFGEQAEEVSRRSLAYARGMQDHGLLPVMKHFPGHGDTQVDSHLDLPVLSHDMSRLQAVELSPFRALIEAGIAGVMTAHLHIPELDPRPRIGATLSRRISHELLQEQLGFKGLVFTDALDMKGVSKYFSAAQINQMAFEAGNDVMLFCVDVPGSIEAIRSSIASGYISEADLNRRVHKQLLAKAWLGLDSTPIPDAASRPSLQTAERIRFIRQLFQASLHWQEGHPKQLLQKGDAWVHISPGGQSSADALAHHQLSGGSAQKGALMNRLEDQGLVRCYSIQAQASPAEMQAIWEKVAHHDRFWLSVGGLGLKAGNMFGLSPAFSLLLAEAMKRQPAAVVWQANPYALLRLPHIPYPTLVCGPEAELASEGIINACTGTEMAPVH